MSYGVEGHEVRKILAQFDAPAFVRRARAVEVADDLLHTRLAKAYATGLEMPRLRLTQLLASLASHDPLLESVASLPGVATRLRSWAKLHAVPLRVPVPPATNRAELADRWHRLTHSVERFNRRWQLAVTGIDLTHINHLREEYNRWYVIEKEAATNSPALARQGFEYRPPLTPSLLLERYPLWPEWLAFGSSDTDVGPGGGLG